MLNQHIRTMGPICGLLCLFAINTHAFAQQEAGEHQDIFEMSIEELMGIEVISASRQSQRIGDLSVPVSVITAEDIHYSGLTNVPEILQFSLGIDMLRLTRHRWAVGVRGLHEFISDRTLVLVNGGSSESPLFGGAEYYTLPILAEDIERIEIVRGPGGAAWGANAFNGVINIITKDPIDVLGAFGSTTVTEFGDSYTNLRWAQQRGKWSWRLSAGYEHLRNSNDAGAGRYVSSATATLNDLMGFSGFAANDFMRNERLATEAVYHYSDRTSLSFGTGYSHADVGDWEWGGYYPGGNGWYETVRSYTKLEQESENGRTAYLRWFGNFASSKVPTLMKWDWMQNDIEGQVSLTAAGAHNVTTGANVRLIRLNAEQQNPMQLMYPGEPFDEQFAGAFLIDRWILNDRLSLEGQIRADYYSETQTDWATRLTALRAMDKQKDHALRLSFARAFRTPFTSPRRTLTSRIPLPSPPFPADLYAFNVIPADELENEGIYSLEAGYTGKLTANVTLRADAYYQRYSKLIGYTKVYDAVGLPYHKAENIDGADSEGAEVELTLEGKLGKLSVWHAYNDFREDTSQQGIRAYVPAKHKVGLTGRLFWPDGWTFNANYKYTATTRTLDLDTTISDAASSHRLDLVLAKKLLEDNCEIMFGAADVLNETEDPHFGIGQLTAHGTPGRMFFTRLQLSL
ncbi:MAG: TonB-dependent receptor [Candidatus Eisenbacteria bacterium]